MQSAKLEGRNEKMTLDKTAIQTRRDRILSITVEYYVKTITPVSSSLIASEFPLDLSSATIRNILSELEEEGFLTHPHTSAGRVPTQKGYRYYVDYLMDQIKLLEEEKQRIKDEYEKENRELERLLEKTSQVISEITHYTSIVSVDGWKQKLFCRGTGFIVDYPDYNYDIDQIRHILHALDAKEELLRIINKDLVNKIEILIGAETEFSNIDQCSLVVSQYKAKAFSGRIAVLGPTRMNYQRVVSTLNYISDLIEEIL